METTDNQSEIISDDSALKTTRRQGSSIRGDHGLRMHGGHGMQMHLPWVSQLKFSRTSQVSAELRCDVVQAASSVDSLRLSSSECWALN